MFAFALLNYRGMNTDHDQFREIEGCILNALESDGDKLMAELIRNGAAVRTISIVQTMGADYAPVLPRVFWRRMERRLDDVLFRIDIEGEPKAWRSRVPRRVRIFSDPAAVKHDPSRLNLEIVLSLFPFGFARNEKEKDDGELDDDPASIGAVCTLVRRSVTGKRISPMLMQYVGVALFLCGVWCVCAGLAKDEHMEYIVQWLLARSLPPISAT